MNTPFDLLRFVTKALCNAAGGGILGDLLVDVLPGVAQDIWQRWNEQHSREELRQELETIAQAEGVQIRMLAAQLVQEIAAAQSPEMQQKLESYLIQLPAAIRGSMRRPADPSGTTVPAGLVPRKAEDLLRFLPPRVSRFKSGEQPLPGVDWELERLLGIGGFGEVWKARNPHLANAEPVALKFCLDTAAAQQLRNETELLDRIMQQGQHPGIAQLRHTFLSADTPCLAYEYVDGGDLGGLIQEWHHTQDGPTPEQAARVIHNLAEIVGFAHAVNPPIVHRDLKPANILVYQENSEVRYKVADFGIGGVAVQQSVRKTFGNVSQGQFLVSALQGSYTPLYASPQQMRGESPDPRDDVYALGVIWYQLLTGNLQTGRPGGTLWQKRLEKQGMNPALVGLLADCFEEERDDRPADGYTLAEAVTAVLDTNKAPLISQKKLRPLVNRRRVGAIALATLILTAFASFIIGRNTANRAIGMANVPTDPQLGDTWINSQDGAEYVWIPAGGFTVGSTSDVVENAQKEMLDQCPECIDYFKDELPQRAGYVNGIWIMQTPVTTSQYVACIEAGVCDSPSFEYWDQDTLKVSKTPIGGISWHMANTYADWVGGRLPTESEWEKACRGTDARIYPWGNEAPTDEEEDRIFGNYIVGSFPEFASPYGIYDMVGTTEWTSDRYNWGIDIWSLSFFRAVRGDNARCASREKSSPSEIDRHHSFRVVIPTN
ncbi:MAG: bifunctional serine/threonine-protein kinase/formylglycine-generating enzyme family protein [Chloroflexota bacterium]